MSPDANPAANAPLGDTSQKHKAELPAFYNDLALTLETAWRMLAQGATDRDAPLHMLAVASVDPDGRPQQRSMVLRECHRAERALQFHTDVRAVKVAELQAQPRVSVLGYDHGRRTQLRIAGNVQLLSDGPVVERAWQTMRNVSRVAYRSSKPPGTIFASVDEHESLNASEITVHDTFARENFCVIQVAVEELEWVYLNGAGNRRARFSWPDGDVVAYWLQA
jgi:pyridoxamine 5'-phosphate oxidase